MKVNVILTNNFGSNEYQNYFLNSVCLVIDVLRATSTITAILGSGADSVIVSKSKEQAFKLRENNDDYILCGEEKGIIIEGFDYDNSPYEISKLDLKGRSVVLKTTNGTKSFIKAKESKAVFSISILNLYYTVDCMLDYINKNNSNITVLCSGKEGMVAYDDAFTAGLVVKYLLKKPLKFDFDDNAILVLNAALSEKNIIEAFAKSSSGKACKRLKLDSDIQFCSKLNKYKITGKLEVRKDNKFKSLFVIRPYFVQ